MKKKKLQEISAYDIQTGKYFSVGTPIVLITKNDRYHDNYVVDSKEDREHKFQQSLEEVIGTVQFPYKAEFFVRGNPKGWAEIREDKKEYIDRDYWPVQFYAMAKFTINVSPKFHPNIGDVSDRDCDRRAAGISNAY